MSPDRSPTFCEHRPERHDALDGPKRAPHDWYGWEHRTERPHDDVDAGHVLHPNGTLIGSYSPAFLGAATREVLELHGWKGRK